MNGKQAGEQGNKQGGKKAVKKFSEEIGLYRQIAFPQKGENLTVDAQPGPAQHEGGQTQLIGASPRQAPNSAGQFDDADEQFSE